MLNRLRQIHPDIFIAVFLLVFLSFLWQVNNEAPPRASQYPKYLLLFSYLLTMGLLITSLRKKSAPSKKANAGSYKQIMIITLITVIYVAMMNYLGFGVSTFVYMFTVLWILEVRRLVIVILVPLLTTAILYFIFNNLLMVLLPQGYFFGG
ncbi:tripartite tricarboxylate transporter TctB family protein [Alkalihalobacillus oceani]|uniref:tripartite tricarboxylate transporter TctB family protein n=1 Tax=Halalkalibacter oceani TaxID=1653776 RepID=UPI00203FE186|nr:tripartite tricarboxylate transporter TctB family protein [Halalkalibacter oceani]MCM3762984.1 tripartite tricarboxylate transporter TctB family protein [Halalkalibacter oceani]